MPLDLSFCRRLAAEAMFTILFSLLSALRACFRTRGALQTEILALRHQLLVLQRSNRTGRLGLRATDRLLWVWLSRLWADWRSALLIVKPKTVIAWHRKGFRLYWRWQSRNQNGRPSVSPEIRDLVRRISLANPRWGAPPSSAQSRAGVVNFVALKSPHFREQYLRALSNFFEV